MLTRSGSSTTKSPPHAPARGWAHKVLGDFHVTGLFWYQFHRWGVKILPSWMVGPTIIVFTTFFFLSIVNIRHAIASNLAAATGPCGFFERQRRIFRTMHAFAWCLSERYERLVTDRPFRVEVEGKEYWDAVAGRSDGIVVVTAHLGLYEVGSMIPAQTGMRHVHLVRETEVDPRAQEFIRRTVSAVEGSHYTMHFQTGNPLFALSLVEALQRGEIVAIQADRPRTGGKCVASTLFGRPFDLPAGPAVVARIAGAPMLPVFAFRLGRRHFRLRFRAPIHVAHSASRLADVESAMRRVAAEIEEAVRAAPHQWFVFRELWPSSRRP
jgi:lauroyl/myristoyl acyltransferase